VLWPGSRVVTRYVSYRVSLSLSKLVVPIQCMSFSQLGVPSPYGQRELVDDVLMAGS
jgi:hypothetical protein